MSKNKKSNISNDYFTEQTENYIIQFNNEQNQYKKQLIYQRHIHDAFCTIVNSLIHKYKYYSSDLSLQDLKNDVVSFMFTKLHMFQKQKGKAFSYFSVMAKNYLTIEHRKIYRQNKLKFSLDQFNQQVQCGDFADVIVYNSINRSSDSIISHNLNQVQIITKNMVNKVIDLIQSDGVYGVNLQHQYKILNTIVHLLKSYKNLQLLQKKAIFFYIQQCTGYNYHKIFNTLKKLAPYYDKIKNEATMQYFCKNNNQNLGKE